MGMKLQQSTQDNDKTLQQLYASHNGKATDKWSSYLAEYEQLFQLYRNKALSVLEIGVQNGGSLEVWATYFSRARKVLGCDIDSKCANLTYEDPRIAVVVGDANSDETQNAILEHASEFDIVIDDGSHCSSDIVKSFARYFPCLTHGGIYIVEDLHCSYWREFGGGLYYPLSAIAFFKRLADVVNHEHWGARKPAADILRSFFSEYGFYIADETLSAVHSVQFMNSLGIIRRQQATWNRLDSRVVVGSLEAVTPGRLKLHGTKRPSADETSNEWTTRGMPPEEELPLRLEELAVRDSQLGGLKTRIDELERSAAQRDAHIASLHETVTERDRRIITLNDAVADRDGEVATQQTRIEALEWAVESRLANVEVKRIWRIAELEICKRELEKAISQRDEHTRTLHETVAERDEHIRALHESVAERDEHIRALHESVAEQDGRILTVNDETLAERNSKLGELKTHAGQLESSLQSAEAELETRRVELKHSVEEASRLRQRLANLEVRLSSVYNSHSWRITKPLRILGLRHKSRWILRNARRVLGRVRRQSAEPHGCPHRAMALIAGRVREALIGAARMLYRRAPLPLGFKRRGKQLVFRYCGQVFRKPKPLHEGSPGRRVAGRAAGTCLDLSMMADTQTGPRVLAFSHNLNGAEGAPHSLFELCEGLRSRFGIALVVVSPTDGSLRVRYEAAQIPVVVDPVFESPFKAHSDAVNSGGIKALEEILDRLSIRAVIGNTAHAVHVVHTARSAGLPAIWIIRESEDPEKHFARSLSRDWRLIFLHALRCSEQLVFVSQKTKERWMSVIQRDDKTVTVIPNGINLQRFSDVRSADRSSVRADLGLREDQIALLNVGTICARKNQQLLLDALLLLQDSEREKVKAIFVGDVATGDGASLRFIEHMQSDDRLSRCAVHVPPTQDIGDYYLASDAYVLTSLMESYPRVVLEAMHFGLPIIASPVFGVLEQTRQGVNALYCDPMRPETLADCIRQILIPEVRERLSQGSHEQLRAIMDYDTMLERYGALLQSVPSQDNEYSAWMRTVEPTIRREAKERQRGLPLESGAPMVSIVVPVFRPDMLFLVEMVRSVFAQSYENWQLCLVDDGSGDPELESFLRHLGATDNRVAVLFRDTNGGISRCLNSALELIEGEFFVQLDQDDMLADTALLRLVETIKAYPDLDMAFSDEDKVDTADRRYAPYFKSGYNQELLYTHNYMTHFAAYRTSLVRRLGGYQSEYDGAQDLDLNLRVIEATERRRIRHIPDVLYHWRAKPGSTALSYKEKPYQGEAGRAAVSHHLERRDIRAKVVAAPKPNYRRVIYSVPEECPDVAIIVPTHDNTRLLRKCVDSVLNLTDYSNYRVLVVDNLSTDPQMEMLLHQMARDKRISVMRYENTFNYAALNNEAVSKTDAAMVCFLNDDTEVIASGWLRTLVSYVQQKDVGVAGAKLYYADDTVQHFGVILGLGIVAGHLYRFLPRSHDGYACRAMLAQDISAVTGACMMMRGEVFSELGGFDESLAVNYNDVDLCLRAWNAGYRVVVVPQAELYHQEGATRSSIGTGAEARLKADKLRMLGKWGHVVRADPFVHPYLEYEANYETRTPTVFRFRARA
jgi:GT2 family glycosyltransferase/glycosyltransferase involved in cell wall biosynthesis